MPSRPIPPPRRTAPGARRRSWLRAAGATTAAAVLGSALLVSGTGASPVRHHGTPVGGTLTVADTGFPSSMDPAGGQNAYNQYYDLAYSPLIYWAQNGQYVPDLATSWSYGPRNESFTMTLRPGVHFSDGSLLTASAVKTWIGHELKVPGGNASIYLAALRTIRIDGPLKLTLFFSKPAPQLPQVFSQGLEMGLIGSPKAVAANNLSTTTDGAGEYVLDKAGTVVGSIYTFTPNPHFWDPSAIHWKKVVIRYIPSPTTTLQAMQSGQVQVAVQQTVASISAAKNDGFGVTKPLQAYYGLAINDRGGKIVPALGNVKVRQAINYAINRAALNKAVFDNQALPLDEPALPGNDGYVKGLAHYYSYNVAKAKQLLAQAGYPHGFTMHILDVNGLNFNLLAEAISGELAQVGITAIPVTASNIADYFGKLASGKYETSILGFGGLPAYYEYDLLLGPHASQFNPLKTESPLLNSLYNKLLVSSESQAVPYAQAMVRYVTKNAWFAIADATPFVAFSAKGIGGMGASALRPEWYLPNAYPAK